MRISDWSSDVCSSDLFPIGFTFPCDQMRMSRAEDDIGEVRMAFDEFRKGSDHDLYALVGRKQAEGQHHVAPVKPEAALLVRSEEHTSELQSLMRISYAVFCLNKKTHNHLNKIQHIKLILTHHI